MKKGKQGIHGALAVMAKKLNDAEIALARGKCQVSNCHDRSKKIIESVNLGALAVCGRHAKMVGC